MWKVIEEHAVELERRVLTVQLLSCQLRAVQGGISAPSSVALHVLLLELLEPPI